MKKYNEDFTTITPEVYDKIQKATEKLNCIPIMVCRLTNHPEDDCLYAVIGQYNTPHQIYGKAYCVWTANVSRNVEKADLHYGNYGVSFKNALKIIDDKTRDLNEEEKPTMTRYEMEQKVKEYVTSDAHKLEDYSDIEICCADDYNDALTLMDKRVVHSTNEELEDFCNAIDTNTVDYFRHGCR